MTTTQESTRAPRDRRILGLHSHVQQRLDPGPAKERAESRLQNCTSVRVLFDGEDVGTLEDFLTEEGNWESFTLQELRAFLCHPATEEQPYLMAVHFGWSEVVLVPTKQEPAENSHGNGALFKFSYREADFLTTALRLLKQNQEQRRNRLEDRGERAEENGSPDLAKHFFERAEFVDGEVGEIEHLIETITLATERR